MFPVSGALQLKTSAPMCALPISSAKYAYSTVVNPKPLSESVNQKFHNPRSFAFDFNVSIISVCRPVNCQRSPLLTSAKYSASRGIISSCIIVATLERNSLSRSVIPRFILRFLLDFEW